MRKIEIDLDEARRVFELMEKINDFFHQPENYKDAEKFAKKNYDEIRTAYYDLIWNWLPKDVQEEIIED